MFFFGEATKAMFKICFKNVQFWLGKFGSDFAKNEIASLRHFLPGMVFICFFLVCFCMGVGGPWVFFGLLLGLLLVSWEVHGRKNVKNPGFFQVL